MAYDEQLAEQICRYFQKRRDVEEKRMFEGLCFMLNGHMCCGIHKRSLMIRVTPDRYEVLFKKTHVSVVDITGKPMRGFLFVSQAGCRTTSSLAMARRSHRVRQVEAAQETQSERFGRAGSSGYASEEIPCSTGRSESS